MRNQSLFNLLNGEHNLILLESELDDVVRAVDEDRACSIMVCKGCGTLSTTKITPPALGCCPDANFVPLQEWIDSHFQPKVEWNVTFPLSVKTRLKKKTKKVDCANCGGQGHYKGRLKIGIQECPQCEGRGYHLQEC